MFAKAMEERILIQKYERVHAIVQHTIHKTFTRAKYFLVYRVTPVMMSSGHIHGHVIDSGKMLTKGSQAYYCTYSN